MISTTMAAHFLASNVITSLSFSNLLKPNWKDKTCNKFRRELTKWKTSSTNYGLFRLQQPNNNNNNNNNNNYNNNPTSTTKDMNIPKELTILNVSFTLVQRCPTWKKTVATNVATEMALSPHFTIIKILKNCM